MTDPAFLVGVDTGGTYTDAAVVDAATRTVLASAKALTTRGDLAIGIGEAIRAAVARLPQRIGPSAIGLVAVSTTLATNAVVEGHGGPTAAILVGFDTAMANRTGIAAAFPGMPVELVGGGHDHRGAERAPLDEAAVAAAVARHAATVEAYAVAAEFATRNAAHERRVREIVVDLTGKPVTISTELSSALDAPRRALTATLNARLISRISGLIDAVSRATAAIGIRAPLMIVKGDGALALAWAVATRPIETVLSGPAASLVGARWLSGLDGFILSDMGGTTTDLAVFDEGRARITDDGADLGGWRTMVRAIDVRTVGLGGDSEVTLGPKGEIEIGPARVLPIALVGSRFPEILDVLDREIAHPTVSSQAGRFVLRPLGWRPGDTRAATLSAREAEMLEQIGDRPVPVATLSLGPSSQRTLASLRTKGLVQVAGLTPSDAAHALGRQGNWSRPAAEKALALAVRLTRMQAPTDQRIADLASAIFGETVRLAATEVLGTALGPLAGAGPLVQAVCRGERSVGLAEVSISPRLPLVAVGGPARVYYDEVARRLGADIVFPPHCDVANAVGAATASVARSVTVTVTGDGNGVFRVHAPDRVLVADSGASAIALATEAARSQAREAAIGMGAADPQVRIEVVRRLLPGASDDSGLFDATVTAEATGQPDLAGLSSLQV
ncbi:MAG TPA: hydantoinase/oxoprolinase family protein [Methylomirabilota bacterium]|nr:hydantoinase/oxoprolinase family protein [Methylomirabilota bacterium]